MNDRLFLTRDEVKQLTGTADRKRQTECLRQNRIAFTMDVFGRPVVTRSAIEGKPAKAEEKQGWPGPSFLKVA